MKKILVLVTVFITSFVFSQEDTTAVKKWRFGVGFNLINNTATADDRYFDTADLNAIPFVSTFSLDYKYSEAFSVGGVLSLNELSSKNRQNGMSISNDYTYVAFDINAKYTFDQHLVDVRWFDASIVGGAGVFMVDKKGNQSFNVGLALDFWVTSSVGLRLHTLGKFAANEDLLGNNHLQHAAELLVKF
ncbi:MAG: hypothetical protein R2790_08500 [Flavobacterium haoranii]